ncbi:hypothetical protein EMIHUDRAFT_426418 [Emiliania huxleyi CCMP1516]|uniref:Palmitoyl-protein thioesterase 1 n=2 Tax=Emiliania huxleyi TaxID=2903 RepID=A0A0D3KM37_EMIH1|nr:hypothetical protein EMIHUDRAFT_426418 [Emiliania huxleyi CCMP1516]EOD36822.1 hypothetical protein EMIHUDRAFT_426418 [Emiliania huxleyi CCMP1516]|eukprot:XP_005789251.1 hypothetical protein EMIHUDRAFT_426418 [Emiliania huxleyi CCMP1516]
MMLALSLFPTTYSPPSSHELAAVAPTLLALVERAVSEPEALAAELSESPLAAIAPTFALPDVAPTDPAAAGDLPIVVTHGMGDSCFNPGMQSVVALAGKTLGVEAVCVPTGDNQASDTINGFLMNMDKSVEAFAKRVQSDKRLSGGFDAFGLSQGNNIIRGYIAAYNDPPVRNFLSICGINAGVAAFPHCAPSTPVLGSICEALTEVLGKLAYNPIVQDILFQANYFRDPTRRNSSEYLSHSRLALWNGERPGVDMSARKARWAKVERFVWVEGSRDSMVWPRQGEQWGDVPSGYPKQLSPVPYNETRWYTEDTFGLQTAGKAGKNFFESFDGDHIRFTSAELQGWLKKYFK